MLDMLSSIRLGWKWKEEDLLETHDILELSKEEERFYPSAATASADLRESKSTIESILEIYEKLKILENRFDGLRTCDESNLLFTQLVGIVVENRGEKIERLVLGDIRIRNLMGDLRRICDKGEGLLEEEWARNISGDAIEADGMYTTGYMIPFSLLTERNG